jgi:apolipoprotein N-acyltransferase
MLEGKLLLLAAALIFSAYLMSVAMSSPEHWWLGWTTLVPLFCAIRWLTPYRAYLAGGLWGLSLFLFAGLLDGSAVSANFISLLALTAVPAFYAGCGACLTRRVGFSPYLLALGWIGVELILQPLGLRHGLLGATQENGMTLQVVGSFSGYLVVAFIVAYVNALLFTVLSTVQIGGAVGRRMAVRSRGPRSIVPIDVPSCLSYLLQPSHPRAPPA